MDSVEKSRVLVVEDEPLIGLDVARLLQDAGYQIIGPFRTVEAAVGSIIAQDVDTAVLDFNLGNATSLPIADALAAKGIPFVWLSGYSRDVIPELPRKHPLVPKPFKDETLLASLAGLHVCSSVARCSVGLAG